jgi:glucose/arabinose dehydrogenase
VNIIERGKNYGWPLATHGINYSMQPIPEAKGKTAKARSPAPCLGEIAGCQRHGVLRR